MERRGFLGLVGGTLAAWPLGVRAQQTERMRRVGVLQAGANSESTFVPFEHELDRLGWHLGRNIQIDVRAAEADASKADELAAQLVALSPDVILASNTQMAQLFQATTHGIPIVFANVPDPVGSGLVASFARPGGNLTGFTNFDASMGGKWLEFLKEAAPGLTRVAVILQEGNLTQTGYLNAIEDAARAYSVKVNSASLKDGPGIDATLEAFAAEPHGGLIIPPSALTNLFRDRIIERAAQKRLPAIYPYSEFATAGGLMSYGVSQKSLYEQAAVYVDRILKGERAGDLPVQTPTKFEMMINLKTANALGLTVSREMQLLADEVIE